MSALLKIYDKSIKEFKEKLKNESNIDLDKKSNSAVVRNIKAANVNVGDLKQESDTMNRLVVKNAFTKGSLNLSNIKMLAPLNVLLLTDLKGPNNCPIQINTNENLLIGNNFPPSKLSDKISSTFLNIIEKNVTNDVVMNNLSDIRSGKFYFKTSKKQKNNILILNRTFIKDVFEITLFPNQNILIIALNSQLNFTINSQIECCPKPKICPKPTVCPKPINLIPYYGAIGGLVLIIILLLIFKRCSTNKK